MLLLSCSAFGAQKKVEKIEFNKIHMHPFAANCQVCHTSDKPSKTDIRMYKGKWICYKCHAYVYQGIKSHLYHHKDVQNCAMCHDPHGSNFVAMLRSDGIDVCMRCHATNKAGFCIHPQGEKHKDPRNGQAITCVTCHYPMGTDYKHLLRKNGEAALCLECHVGY